MLCFNDCIQYVWAAAACVFCLLYDQLSVCFVLFYFCCCCCSSLTKVAYDLWRTTDEIILFIFCVHNLSHVFALLLMRIFFLVVELEIVVLALGEVMEGFRKLCLIMADREIPFDYV